MQPTHTTIVPDETLTADTLPILLVITVLLGFIALGLLSLWANLADIWAYLIIPGTLLLGSVGSSKMRRCGNLRRAAAILSYAYCLSPILTALFFGVNNNPLIYLSAIGVLIAAILVSTESAFAIAGQAILLLFVVLFLVPANLGQSLLTILVVGLLLLGTACLGALAGSTIRGTIEWALDNNAKSERREMLLRETQDELQQAIYQRERLNTALQQANRDLEAARAAAEAAYQSKASFMAAMSHELRTPLNLIIGFSTAMIEHPEMYEDQLLPDMYRADVVEVRRSGQHLLGLINDILDLAKVEAGRLELHKAPLALAPLLDEMLKNVGGLVMNRPVVLRREFEEDLPCVLADDVRVRQVLLNLLSNASKFTDRGEIGLGARDGGDKVVVWVRDTGMGIAAADQARIFSEFEQVESEESKRRGGTGLGLSICRWLIELHGGRMGVKSEPGRGSIFYFTLPVVDVTRVAAPEWMQMPELVQ